MAQNKAVNVGAIEGAQDEISGVSNLPEAPADVTITPSGDNGLNVGSTPAPSDHRANGQWAPRNRGAVTHGGRRQQPIVDPAATALYGVWANDLGGAEELTAGERVLLQRAVEADAIAGAALGYLKRSHQSLVNPRVQSALTVWGQATSQLLAISRTLGLQRRAKQVDPLDAVRRAVDQANAR